MTLPHDFTFCLSPNCGKRDICSRYDAPKDAKRPLSFADFYRYKQGPDCENFIIKERG